MTRQFRLTQPAIQDIEEIADYIASRSGLDRADRFLSNLDAKFAKIAKFLNLGRQRDEILPSLRSLPIDNYLILYMPIGQDVEIFRVEGLIPRKFGVTIATQPRIETTVFFHSTAFIGK